MRNDSVAIIGAGITGLTAAFRLQQRGIPVIVYEAGPRVGGVIQSVRQGGFLAECGPNSILETSPKIASLIADLGLEQRRLYSEPRAEKRYLVRGGKPVEMPVSLGGFLKTPLFSAGAKLRLFREPFVRRAAGEAEESIAEFVVRRLGQEFLDYAIDPLVAGVYAGDPARLSVKEAFPKLHALEQRYGSLILGQTLGARERRRRAEVSKQSAKKFSFDEGLQTLVDTLHQKLGNAVQLRSPVASIRLGLAGWRVIAGGEGARKVAEHSAVLFAGTAGKLAQLNILADGVPSLAPLAQIHHPPVASVVLGFRREDVAHPLDGFGMLIPRVEKCHTLGTLFSSTLFPGRAPAGHVTLTSYIGGARNPDLALKDPGTLAELARQDLRKLLGVSGEPAFQHSFVYREAIPQYNVGFGRMRELMARVEATAPGLFLAGHYRNGISLGDSLVAGHDAATRIAASLGVSSELARHIETPTLVEA